uniref:Uncharacterized protein n=1 Tax=Rhizophora mucronata TaxID=61149 RepID=A0A2P2L5M5_RHIMU
MDDGQSPLPRKVKEATIILINIYCFYELLPKCLCCVVLCCCFSSARLLISLLCVVCLGAYMKRWLCYIICSKVLR